MNASIPNSPKKSWARTALLATAGLIAYLIAVMISGMVLGALGVPLPAVRNLPGMGLMVISATILVFGLIPLAQSLTGSRAARAIALAVLVYVTCSLNTAIESSIFTTIGGGAFMILSGILPALVVGIVLARVADTQAAESFGMSVREHVAMLRHRRAWFRLLLAWLAFPVVYYTFGIMIAPIVTPIYRAGIAGLVLPSAGTVILTQLGRSAIYLCGTLPVLVLLRGSTRSQIARLGLGYWCLTGLSSLVSATFFPMVLRVVHSAEICGDAFVYSALLVLLLGRRSASATAQTSAASA